MHPFSVPMLFAPAVRASSHLANVIVVDLPSDPASLTILILLIGSVGAVVWLGRSKGPPT